jgi:hypothetical protein
MNYSWPPKKSTMRFAIPYKQAVLVDDDGAPVKNITTEFNQYAGPRSDFHGSPDSVSDVIYKPFTKIRITNIMNQQSTINLGG